MCVCGREGGLPARDENASAVADEISGRGVSG